MMVQTRSSRRHKAKQSGLDNEHIDQVHVMNSNAIIMIATMLFVIFAYDQTHTKYLEEAIDKPVHQYMLKQSIFLTPIMNLELTGILGEIQSKITWGKILSNAPVALIALSIAAIAMYHTSCLLIGMIVKVIYPSKGMLANEKERSHIQGLLRTVIIFVFAERAGGRGFKADTALMEFLKEYFGRERPSGNTRIPSLSFPSGHTNAACFFAGSLFAMMLPTLVKTTVLGNSQVFKKVLRHAWWLLWVLSVAFTAFGRIVSNRHWVSDTLAGAAIGVVLVSLQCKITVLLEKILLKKVKKN